LVEPPSSLVEPPRRQPRRVETTTLSLVEPPRRQPRRVETTASHVGLDTDSPSGSPGSTNEEKGLDQRKTVSAGVQPAAMAYTYMLRCRDGTLYVGSTRDIDRRLEQHQLGLGSAYTRRRLPVELVWFEQHEHIGAAFDREKQIQNWSRAKRQALIDHRYDLLPQLARRRGRGKRVGLDTGSPSGSPGSTNEDSGSPGSTNGDSGSTNE
jgi:putative endonuclease